MKQYLKEPLVLALILVVSLVYVVVLFHYVSRRQYRAAWVENFYICLFVITIAGATGTSVFPLPKFHPRALSNTEVTLPTVAGQLGFYFVAILLLSSRFRYTLQNLVVVISKLLVGSPFLMAFLAIIGLSPFWSDTPGVTFKTSMVYLATSLVAIYVGKQYNWRELFGIARWTGLCLIALSFFYSLALPGSGRNEDGNWVGVLSHKNQFCFMMIFAVMMWFVNSLYKPKEKGFSLVIVFLGLIAMYFGGSGAARAIVVCLFALWFYLGTVKKIPPQWAFVSVILFFIVSACAVILISENLEFIVVDTLNKDLTLTGRTEFWPLILDKINERPFFGYGIDGFWQPWRGDEDPARSIIVVKTQFTPPHSHNGFLDIACDLGYVGLSLMISSFVTTIAKSVNYLVRTPMPEGGLPLLILAYIFMTNLTETGLLGVTSIWFWYIVVAVRTSLDTAVSPFSSQKSR